MNERDFAMLVVERSVGQSVMIGKDIEVRVIKNSKGRLRLGFVAPKEVQIVRTELINKTDKIPTCHFNGNEPLVY